MPADIASRPGPFDDLIDPLGLETAPSFISVTGNRITAKLPSSKGGTISRTIMPADLSAIAGRLDLSQEATRRLAVDVFAAWGSDGYCGPHDGWLTKLETDMRSRYRARQPKEKSSLLAKIEASMVKPPSFTMEQMRRLDMGLPLEDGSA